jgi:hypothetical protein
LKVEATGNAIYVQHFSGKIKARAEATFHGFEVDIPEPNATAGHKFFFENALTANGIKALVQFYYQLLQPLFRQVGPG